VLDQQLPSDPLRLDTLRLLSTALLTRFTQTGWVEDFNEAFILLMDVFEMGNNAVYPQTSDVRLDLR
jgi:hypothetical protein